MTHFTRRRFLTIAASSVAFSATAEPFKTAKWYGQAMGAPTVMKLAGVSPSRAAPLFERVEKELRRLEGVFSLYRGSELVQLNRDKLLDLPSPELLEVLSLSDSIYTASGGAFDPSIQPLWQAISQQRDPEAQRNQVGWSKVSFDTRRVVLADGMALTLNGIAQGFITDRITDMLLNEGFCNVLMDMGEIVALGYHADGRSWELGVAGPDGHVLHRLKMRDRALATSAVSGMKVGAFEHILHPAGIAPQQSLVAVSAPRAVIADGLSTAMCLMSPRAGRALVNQFRGARVEFSV